MKRSLFSILIVLALAACSNNGGSGYGGPQYSSEAHFLSGEGRPKRVRIW